MSELTEREELERKILLQQQAIAFFLQTDPIGLDACRKRIVQFRQRLWEIEDGRTNQRAAA